MRIEAVVLTGFRPRSTFLARCIGGESTYPRHIGHDDSVDISSRFKVHSRYFRARATRAARDRKGVRYFLLRRILKRSPFCRHSGVVILREYDGKKRTTRFASSPNPDKEGLLSCGKSDRCTSCLGAFECLRTSSSSR